MKTTIKLFIPVLFLIISACEGPRGPVGPPGPQGPAGQDGSGTLAQVFETQPADFIESEQWAIFFDIPEDFEIFESDIIAAYILWETDNGLDIWRPLPQYVFETQPSFAYNFDYTLADVRFFLDAENLSNLNNLPPGYLNGQIFRFVVIPAEFASARMDLTNYEEVTKMLNLDEDDVIKIKK
ncbi:collagen-like protein [Mangrovivirga cuniculi]|uniref:Collagen-like protein n=1 Tax=Mangrovivirga cuniculi TaxID=2715131 RepID=A0A4D7JT41_9BACT|nr:collagen-like protein [Mangrovivirga cuniculi]QCK15852.1 hypothetical protein DCC35_14410 [Mangrovivirga cuniculi]